MIVFSQGLRGSVTQAWRGKTTIGDRRFTISVIRGVKPATAERTFLVSMTPWLVSTPVTLPPLTRIPVTSVF